MSESCPHEKEDDPDDPRHVAHLPKSPTLLEFLTLFQSPYARARIASLRVSSCEAKDRELRRVGDLAAGASSEDDARVPWLGSIDHHIRVIQEELTETFVFVVFR